MKPILFIINLWENEIIFRLSGLFLLYVMNSKGEIKENIGPLDLAVQDKKDEEESRQTTILF